MENKKILSFLYIIPNIVCNTTSAFLTKSLNFSMQLLILYLKKSVLMKPAYNKYFLALFSLVISGFHSISEQYNNLSYVNLGYEAKFEWQKRIL